MSLLTLLVSLYQYKSLSQGKEKKLETYFFFQSMKAEFLFTFQEGPLNLGFKEFQRSALPLITENTSE